MQKELDLKAYVKSQNRMIDLYGINKDYVYEDTLDGVDVGKNVIPISDVEVIKPSPFKDNEGKKIYEGDIIGYWYDCDGVKKLSTETVFFDETTGQWMLDESIKQDRSYSTSLYAELNDYDYFVRGNIYENPELLKK